MILFDGRLITLAEAMAVVRARWGVLVFSSER